MDSTNKSVPQPSSSIKTSDNSTSSSLPVPHPVTDYPSNQSSTNDDEDSGTNTKPKYSASDRWTMFLDNSYLFLNSRWISSILLLFTIFLLFGEDARIYAVPSSSDYIFHIISSICFFIFILELLLRSVCESEIKFIWYKIEVPSINPSQHNKNHHRSSSSSTHHLPWYSRYYHNIKSMFSYRLKIYQRGYFGSFLFFLDLLAIISMLPEIDWLWTAVLSSSIGSQANLSTVRASRISRIGSRVGRIIRIVRVVRLFKVYSLWRKLSFQWKLQKSNANSNQSSINNQNTPPNTSILLRDFAELRESQMGSRLQHSITRRVIVMVIFMLLIVPVFVNFREDTTNSTNTAALHNMNIWRGSGWEISGLMLLDKYQYYTGPTGFNNDILAEDLGIPRIVHLSLYPLDGVPSSILIDRPDIYSTLRIYSISDIEIDIQEYISENVYLANGTMVPEVRTVVWWNERPHMRSISIHTIGLTVFIIIILGIGALQLAADAQALVLSPIESMIAFVERTALDPVTQRISSKDNTGSYETQVLENAIKKVTGLLRVGFGTTGALIVAKHLDTRSTLDSSNNHDSVGTPEHLIVASTKKADDTTVQIDTSSSPVPSGSFVHGSRIPSVPESSPRGNTNLAFPIKDAYNQTIGRLTRSFTPRLKVPEKTGENLHSIGRNGLTNREPGATGSIRSLSNILRGSTSKLYVTNTNTVIAKHEEGSIFLNNSSNSNVHRTRTGHGGLPTIGLRKEKGLFNPYVPGRSVRAVFVRIGIPNASAMAAVLGPAYLPHFNRIAKIVHDTCLSWGGSPISNDMGTGFTCMWIIDDAWDKLMDDETMIAYVAHGLQRSASYPSSGFLGSASKSLSPVTEETEGESKENESIQVPHPSSTRPVTRRRASVLNLFKAEKDRVNNNDSTYPKPVSVSSKEGTNRRKTIPPSLRRISVHDQRAASLGVAITGLEIGSAHTNDTDGTNAGSSGTSDPVQAMVLASRQMKERNQTTDGINIQVMDTMDETATKNKYIDRKGSVNKYRRASLPDASNGSGVIGQSNKGSTRLLTEQENRSSQRRLSYSSMDGGRTSLTNDTGIELSVSKHIKDKISDSTTANVRSSSSTAPFNVPSIAIENPNSEENVHALAGSETNEASIFFSFDTDETTEEGRARKLLLDTASQVAEKALLFCLKCILALRRARDITESKEMTILRESTILKGYRPSLTFGLHVGSAIECAIGSVRKVDVSYIAPEATKLVDVLHDIAPTYHVPIILSDNLIGILRPNVREYCRKVDRIHIPSVRSLASQDTSTALFNEQLIVSSNSSMRTNIRIISIFTYDVWDWTANIPPTVLRTRMMQIINNNIQNGIRTSLNPYSRISPRRGMGSPPYLNPSENAPGTVGLPTNDNSSLSSSNSSAIELMLPQNVSVTPETLAGLPPILLPLSLMALNSQDADLFNPSRTFIPEHERCISIMGAADIIEHPIVQAQYTPSIWEQDTELKNLRAPYSETFRSMHSKAMDAYLNGNWTLAGQYLEAVGEALTQVVRNQTKRQLPSHFLAITSTVSSPKNTATHTPYEFKLTDLDYVSRMLYTTMAGYGFVPPKNWIPYRIIDE